MSYILFRLLDISSLFHAEHLLLTCQRNVDIFASHPICLLCNSSLLGIHQSLVCSVFVKPFLPSLYALSIRLKGGRTIRLFLVY